MSELEQRYLDLFDALNEAEECCEKCRGGKDYLCDGCGNVRRIQELKFQLADLMDATSAPRQ